MAIRKPWPGSPSRRCARHPAILEAQGRERMRRDQRDALGDREARRVGIDDEGGQALGAGALARAREHDVEVGDAAVRDPGLAAVQDEALAVGRGGRGDRRDVGAGRLLGQGEGCDLAAFARRRKVGAALLLAAEQADRRRIPGPASRTRSRRARRSGRASRAPDRASEHRAARSHRRTPPARCAAESLHRRAAARGCGTSHRHRHDRSGCPISRHRRPISAASARWRSSKNGQARKLRSGMAQLPSNTGLPFATKAR